MILGKAYLQIITNKDFVFFYMLFSSKSFPFRLRYLEKDNIRIGKEKKDMHRDQDHEHLNQRELETLETNRQCECDIGNRIKIDKRLGWLCNNPEKYKNEEECSRSAFSMKYNDVSVNKAAPRCKRGLSRTRLDIGASRQQYIQVEEEVEAETETETRGQSFNFNFHNFNSPLNLSLL